MAARPHCVLRAEDFEAHTSTFSDPISARYRGVDVYEHPPNGQGLIALVALRDLDNVDMRELQPYGPEYAHLVLEALRYAFRSAEKHIADPVDTDVPVAALLDDAPQKFCMEYDPTRATSGGPQYCCDTVSFQVVDSCGNAVSMVNSNYMGFGTGIVLPGTGFPLQNRGANFSLDPVSPNALRPGARPYHTIIPAMATKDGEFWASFSNMGGFMQPQGHVQLLCGLLDFGRDPQEAVDAPRFCILPGGSAPAGVSGAGEPNDAGVDGGTGGAERGGPAKAKGKRSSEGKGDAGGTEDEGVAPNAKRPRTGEASDDRGEGEAGGAGKGTGKGKGDGDRKGDGVSSSAGAWISAELADTVLVDLSGKGHVVGPPLSEFDVGRAQIILRTKHGLACGSDRRADGCAAGF